MLLCECFASGLGIRCRKLVSWVAISSPGSFLKPFPRRSVLTAMCRASTDVESSPISIHVERGFCHRVAGSTSAAKSCRTGRPVPSAGLCALRRRIQSRRHAFWEGYIHTKNPEIDRVDDWGMALAVGPGQFIRDGESGATTNPGSEVTCSRPNPQDLHRRSTA